MFKFSKKKETLRRKTDRAGMTPEEKGKAILRDLKKKRGSDAEGATGRGEEERSRKKGRDISGRRGCGHFYSGRKEQFINLLKLLNMNDHLKRRKFLKTTASVAAGLTVLPQGFAAEAARAEEGKRIGIIGLDTSHSIAFTREFNADDPDPALRGYRVVAAYPHGSADIESSVSRIPKYTKQIRELGVKVVGSIGKLLKMVDVVLLETNDGRPHLEQSVEVMRAGKTMFIDKPLTASLADAVAIYSLARKYRVPVFSSSSLRYTGSVQQAARGEAGKIVGASTYGPSSIEKTHPDLYWYGIHAVEMLYTIMGTGCESVTRVHTESTDVAAGVWADGRVGTFRGMRAGIYEFGGTAFGEKSNITLGGYSGYKPLLLEIAKFFDTKVPPVRDEETLELYAFMSTADESRRRGGVPVPLQEVMGKAREAAAPLIRKYE